MNWPIEHNPNNANATPVFDDWGWGDYWSMNDWLTWHNALVVAYGEPIANDFFVNTWLSENSWLNEFGDERATWLDFNTSFRDYLRNHQTSTGLSMLDALTSGNIISMVVGFAADTVSGAGSVVTGALDTAAGATDATTGATKTLKWLLPALLIVAAIGLVIYANKKFKIINLKT